MSRNINKRYAPNTTNIVDVRTETPYGMACYPTVLFYDSQDNPLSPASGTLTIEHSLDGNSWRTFTNGQTDFSAGVVGEPFRNGRISKIRLTTSGLTGVLYIDVNYHVEYDSQKPNEVVVADSFIARNIKRGKQFSFFHEMELASSETRYIAAITGDDIVSLKFRQMTTDGAARYTPRSGATFVENAVIPTVFNLNTLSANTSKTKFYTVTATPTTQGIPFDILRSATGQGNQRQLGIFGGDELERIIAPNTRSLLKFENLESNKGIFIVIEFSYYEGPIAQLPEI